MLTLVCSGVILVQSYGLYAMETRLEPARLGRAYSARPDQNQLTGVFIDIENKTPRSFRVCYGVDTNVYVHKHLLFFALEVELEAVWMALRGLF